MDLDPCKQQADTNGIVERRRDLVTGPFDFERRSQLERTPRDAPTALDHPHRRSRSRSIVDSPASLRSRESGVPRATSVFMSSRTFVIAPCVESGSRELRRRRSPKPSTTHSIPRARATPPPQVAKRRAGEDRLASAASETGGGGGHQLKDREATRPRDRAPDFGGLSHLEPAVRADCTISSSTPSKSRTTRRSSTRSTRHPSRTSSRSRRASLTGSPWLAPSISTSNRAPTHAKSAIQPPAGCCRRNLRPSS